MSITELDKLEQQRRAALAAFDRADAAYTACLRNTQVALLRLLVQAVNTFLAAMREPYRVTAEDVRTSKRGGWYMIGFPCEPRRKR